MSDFINQFFGDAKRLRLSSQEKAELWGKMSAFSASKQITLTSLEKAQSFERIAAHMHKRPIAMPKSSLSMFWRFHKLAASTMIALIVIGAGGGTAVYAAEGAMPNDMLYPVKLHVNERIVGALQRTPEDRVNWEATRIERRLREAEHIAQHKELSLVHQQNMQRHLEERMNHLDEVLQRVPEEHRERITEKIDEQLKRHEAFLSQVEAEVDEEVREFKQGIGALHAKFRSKHRRKPATPKRPVASPPPFVLPDSSSASSVSSPAITSSSSRQQPRRPQWVPTPKTPTSASGQLVKPPILRPKKEEKVLEKDVTKPQKKDDGKENTKPLPGFLRSKHPFFQMNASVHLQKGGPR